MTATAFTATVLTFVAEITADWSKCLHWSGGDVHIGSNVHKGRVFLNPLCRATADAGPGYRATKNELTCPACIQSVLEHTPRTVEAAGTSASGPAADTTAAPEYALTYTTELGPVRHDGLTADRAERMGRIACRKADHGAAWDIAVLDAAGTDRTDEFAFARD